MSNIEDKILKLIDISATKIPFIEYYSHTGCNMYKIENVYSNYSSEILVLSPVSEGFEKALDLAIEQISKKEKQYFIDEELKYKV